MKKNDFYEKFIGFLEIESVSKLNENSKLKELVEYDSLFVLMIVAFVDNNFSMNLTTKQLNEIETIGDLMLLIGNENFTE